jgi:hypothetical protein
MLTKLSLITTRKKVVQDVESSPNFCVPVIGVFIEKNSQVEDRYKVK